MIQRLQDARTSLAHVAEQCDTIGWDEGSYGVASAVESIDSMLIELARELAREGKK